MLGLSILQVVSPASGSQLQSAELREFDAVAADYVVTGPAMQSAVRLNLPEPAPSSKSF